MAPASKIPRPVAAASKTDRLDAMKLAEFLARGMLKSVAIPIQLTRESYLPALKLFLVEIVK